MTVTPAQARILRFLRDYAETHGHAPTVTEVAQSVGPLARTSVVQQLGLLHKHGQITSVPGQPNAVMIAAPDGDA